MKNRKLSRGFTLVELMVVVAIVGIIAAIAYPSYRESVLKGRRAQARAAILDVLQQEERYMTQNNLYMSFSASTPAATNPFSTYVGSSAATAPYTLTADICPGQLINECVMVTAWPTSPDPAVDKLTMTSSGIKSCTGTAQSVSPQTCWP